MSHNDHPVAFASNFFPSLDLAHVATMAELEAAIEREFASKAPTAGQLRSRSASDAYRSRSELLRDALRHLYWTHRYFLTLYVLRPVRWEDFPEGDPDARVPLVSPNDLRLAQAIADAFARLAPGWPGNTEQHVLDLLVCPLEGLTYDAATLTARLTSVDAVRDDTGACALRVPGPRVVHPRPTRGDVLACEDLVPELAALLRQAGAIAREHAGRWGRPQPTPTAHLDAADFVLVAWPRSDQVLSVLETCTSRESCEPPTVKSAKQRTAGARLRYAPTGGVSITALSAVKGELRVTNDMLIANSAWNWSPITAAQIEERTGIRERRYTNRNLDDLLVEAALRALEAADGSVEVAAVVACSATNSQLIPSLAARIADRIGLEGLAAVLDVVAACAGFPYGLALATRIVEETNGSVLLALGEKLSDKIGTVRSSRMLFGDGAAALLLTPATGSGGDIELVETYAGGSSAEVNAVLWPNPAFNNHLTVDAAGARAIVERYLLRILSDLHERTASGSPLHGIDLIVPHQANEPMVREIATAAGLPAERLYFNVGRVGNIGAASIPIAVHDAILDRQITSPARILTPAFGAGSLAGVALLNLRGDIVYPRPLHSTAVPRTPSPAGTRH